MGMSKLEKLYICTTKELFDSIATQNAEIRTVAKSLPQFLKYSARRTVSNNSHSAIRRRTGRKCGISPVHG